MCGKLGELTFEQVEKLIAGGKYRDHGFVFAQPNGEPHREDGLSKRLRAACERAKVPVLTPYDLRHLCATLMLEAGVSLKLVSTQLRHSSVQVTGDVYTHVRDAMQVQATQQLGGLLARARSERQQQEGAR